MKTKLISLLTLCAALALPAAAQTNDVPPTPTSFYQTALGYFTSFSSLQTFQTNYSGLFGLGPDYQDQINTSMLLTAKYNVYRTLGLQGSLHTFGLGSSTLVQAGGGIDYDIIVHDVRISPFLEAGYSWRYKKLALEVGAELDKALTENTYGGVRLAVQASDSPSLMISFLTGFKF